MVNLLNKWKEALSRTRKSTFGQIATFIGATEITDATWSELEAILVQADVGIETTIEIIDSLKSEIKMHGVTKASEFDEVVRNELSKHICNPPLIKFDAKKPIVILLVGVNGSGKTTTVAKLGSWFLNLGKSVILAAADTYRAAAVDQLEVWAERLRLPVIAGQPNADPGAVAFDAVQSAISKKYDILIIDTAGRLHTRFNLMEELIKIHRVIGKALPGAPHATWLVMDATTGQNALIQSKSFHEAIKIDGIILAKLDTSAKGGMAFAIQKELNLPIFFAGIGEKVDDLQPFSRDLFIDGILGK
jgi:fused signal recognition particle receptor